MADEPLEELAGRTPLQSARTPNLDALARGGIVGMVRSIPEGMPPGSDIANMSLMGYDPARYYTGRAPLEAASMGLVLGERDLAFRCNLVTLAETPGGRMMADYSGGGVSSERARRMIDLLNDRLRRPDRTFHAGVSYRHLLVWKACADECLDLETTPPHDISGRAIAPYMPRGRGGERLSRLMDEAREVLAGLVPPDADPSSGSGPNAIWLWGQGRVCHVPALEQRFQVQGAVVCAVDLIKGLGRSAGMRVVPVPGATGDIDTNFQGKAVAALRALQDHDLVFVHVEAPDEASHRGDVHQKILTIERLDHEVVGVLRKGLERKGYRYRLAVLPDHATPVRTRTHCDRPVPFLLASSAPSLPLSPDLEKGRGRADRYDEIEAEKSGILLPGHEFLGRILPRPA